MAKANRYQALIGKMFFDRYTPGASAFEFERALLRKSREGRRFPFPGRTYPARCVSGVPRAVNRFRMAALM